MIGIIKKDLLMMKIDALLFGLLSFMYVAAYFFIKFVIFDSIIVDTNFSRCMLASLPMILVLEFNCKNFQYDHVRSQYERYFNSLPVSRAQMVISKFLSSLIFTTIGFIYSIMSLMLFTIADRASIDYTSLRNITILFLCMIICLGIQLPILMINGNVLMSMLGPIILLSLFISVMLFENDMNMDKGLTRIQAFVVEHSSINKNLLMIVSVLCLIITCLLISLSMNIYKRRDLR